MYFFTCSLHGWSLDALSGQDEDGDTAGWKEWHVLGTVVLAMLCPFNHRIFLFVYLGVFIMFKTEMCLI